MNAELAYRPVKKQTDIEFHKPTLSREDLKGVLECLVLEHLSTGEIVERFEKAFGHTFKYKHTISVNSLTAAYHLAFLGMGVGENDSVLLSSFSPVAALDAIFFLRAKPILVDIGKNSFHPDLEVLQAKLTEFNPKVMLIDHAFGSIFDVSKLNLGETLLIEDFTDVIGATSEKTAVGKQGTLGICGLSAENLITTGNGAMIVTQNTKLAEAIRTQKTDNSTKRSLGFPKFDYSLIDYQAALGIEQLSKLGVILERQRKIAIAYLQAVQSSRLETYFSNPSEDTFQKFPVLVPGQSYEEVERYFKSIRVGTKRVVEEPLHHILEENNSQFPNAERLFQKGHLLPIYPNLTKDNVQRIATSLRRIY